jgi:hypothetical protein
VNRQDLRERLDLLGLVGGTSGEATGFALLERWVAEDKIAVIAIGQAQLGLGELSTTLEESGFTASE